MYLLLWFESFCAVFNPITWEEGEGGQIIDDNSKTAQLSTSKLGDFSRLVFIY